MEKPLCIRLSAEEYFKMVIIRGYNKIINLIKDRGVDIINVSSGGLRHLGKMTSGPSNKVCNIVKAHWTTSNRWRLYNFSHMAEEALQSERADLIFIGRINKKSQLVPSCRLCFR